MLGEASLVTFLHGVGVSIVAGTLATLVLEDRDLFASAQATVRTRAMGAFFEKWPARRRPASEDRR